jgi:hypothetical protein
LLSITPLPVLQRVAGKDASKQFWKYHNEGILKKYQAQLQVGSLDSKKKKAAPPAPPAAKPVVKEAERAKPSAGSAPAPAKQGRLASEAMDPYGELIPYADPSWYQGVWSLPYVRALHARN